MANRPKTVSKYCRYMGAVLPGLLAVALGTPFVQAQGNAAELGQRARAACVAGDVNTGVALLTELFAQSGDPAYVYNQGRCLEQNQRFDAAIERYQAFLNLTPTADPAARAQTQVRIEKLRFAAKSAPPAPVAAPAPAAAPTPVAVPEPVAVAAPVPATAAPVGGDPQIFRPRPMGRQASQNAIAPPRNTVEQVEYAPLPVEEPRDPYWNNLRIGSAVSAVAAVVGFSVGLYQRVRMRDIENKIVSEENTAIRAKETIPYNAKLHEDGESARSKHVGGMVVGGLGAVGAVVFYILADGETEKARASQGLSLQITPGLGTQSAGLTVGGSF